MEITSLTLQELSWAFEKVGDRRENLKWWADLANLLTELIDYAHDKKRQFVFSSE